jgi:gliding motility-associated-like protein
MVCKGSPLATLTGSSGSPSGGDNLYRYTWRQDSANTGWTNIPGYIKSSSASYSRSSIKDPFQYKRYVYSGSNDCCADSSNFVTIGINPLPTGTMTTITDTTVCGGSQVPVKVHLSGASKWRLIYDENGVQATINKIQAADTTFLISRTPLLASAVYLFKLDSLKDANKCIALPATLTGSRKITVYKVPKAVAGIAVDSICGPAYHLAATPSVGLSTWTKVSGPGAVTFLPNIINPNATVKVDSITAAWGLGNTYKLQWKEANWLCVDSSSVQITFYKRTSIANAGKNIDTIYTFDKYYTLHAEKPFTGTGIWSVISGTGLSEAKIMNDSIAYDLAFSPVKNKFLWKITNGKCESADTVTYTIYDLKIPQGFSPNGDGKNDEFVISGFDHDPSVSVVTLRILNSAGTEVFYTSNTSENGWTNWNGQNNGVLPEGTYYYIFIVKSLRNNTVLQKSGFIILKRRKN